jgi:iron complex transport system substrate-binding protein
MRIVTLLPAATEIVAALGAGHQLVGVTHECDYPRAVGDRPRVTASAVDAHAAPGEVDAAVAALAAGGGAIFTLDEAAIARLAPDVVFTQALCDVCAVSEDDVRALAARLAPPPRVVTLGGSTLAGVFDDVRRAGDALGRGDEAAALVAALEARLRRVHETLKAARAPRPRVAVIEWTEPVYAAGHWVPEMVRRAGGVDVLATPGEHSRPRALAEVEAADPEVVVIAPCGYDAPRAAAEAARVLARPEWAWARGRAVWALDANALVSRPGPRLVDGVEALAALLAPSLFPPPPADQAVQVVAAAPG